MPERWRSRTINASAKGLAGFKHQKKLTSLGSDKNFCDKDKTVSLFLIYENPDPRHVFNDLYSALGNDVGL